MNHSYQDHDYNFRLFILLTISSLSDNSYLINLMSIKELSFYIKKNYFGLSTIASYPLSVVQIRLLYLTTCDISAPCLVLHISFKKSPFIFILALSQFTISLSHPIVEETRYNAFSIIVHHIRISIFIYQALQSGSLCLR